MRALWIGFSMMLPLASFSAQLLEDNHIDNGQIKNEICIQQAKENCINNFCQVDSPISESPDCEDICQQRAEESC